MTSANKKPERLEMTTDYFYFYFLFLFIKGDCMARSLILYNGAENT